MNALPTWTDRTKALEPAITEVCTIVPVSAGPGALARFEIPMPVAGGIPVPAIEQFQKAQIPHF